MKYIKDSDNDIPETTEDRVIRELEEIKKETGKYLIDHKLRKYNENIV